MEYGAGKRQVRQFAITRITLRTSLQLWFLATAKAAPMRAQAERIAHVLKSAASLVPPGREPLTPVKVELDQGRDGRILFYFANTDPITPKEKTVEFRLAAPHAGVRKKFMLKEMERQGQLQL